MIACRRTHIVLILAIIIIILAILISYLSD